MTSTTGHSLLRSRLHAATLCASMILVSATARASERVDYIYTGTVGSGSDGVGLFAPTGSSLAGDNFRAAFQFDLSTGVLGNNGGLGPQVYGGTEVAAASPLVSASLTINGKSTSMYGSYYSQVQAIADTSFGLSIQSALTDPVQGSMAMTTAQDFCCGAYPFPLGGLDIPGTYIMGFQTTENYQIETTGNFAISHGDMSTTGIFQTNFLTIENASPVPLPASAWLLIVGLAGLGIRHLMWGRSPR